MSVPNPQGSGIRLQRILVPVDPSGESIIAAQYAAALARQFGAEITLLHVLLDDGGGGDPGIPRAEVLNKMGEAARSLLRAVADGVCGKDVLTRVVICVGRPHAEILDQCAVLNANLIIMAKHGRGGLTRFLRPSTVARVVRDAPCPVLLVRPFEHGFLQEAFSSEPPESLAEWVRELGASR